MEPMQLDMPNFSIYVITCREEGKDSLEDSCYYIKSNVHHWGKDIKDALQIEESEISKIIEKSYLSSIENITNRQIDEYNEIMADLKAQMEELSSQFAKLRKIAADTDPNIFARRFSDLHDEAKAKVDKLTYVPLCLVKSSFEPLRHVKVELGKL